MSELIHAKTQAKEFERFQRGLRNALAVAVLGPLAGGVMTIGGNLIDHQPPPPPTTDTVSVCVNAQTNVQKSLALMNVKKFTDITPTRQVRLETVNAESIDSQCGEEIAIAADMFPPP